MGSWYEFDLQIRSILSHTIEFFLNVFTEFSDKNGHYSKRVRTCHSATSCVRVQDATTVPARHMWETGSLNWAQFMLQWFIWFPEFAEFSESSASFRKNSNVTACHSLTHNSPYVSCQLCGAVQRPPLPELTYWNARK